MNTTLMTGAVAASLICSTAYADFRGFVAFVRSTGTNTVIDVFAGVANANDRLLNCYNRSISTSLPSGFLQLPGTTTRGWRPDVELSTRSSSNDSFMTLGVQGGAPILGVHYASESTIADPNFTNWSTTGATFVPPNAGWYLNPPTLPDNLAESLAGMPGTRVDLSLGNAPAYGVWCAHLVLANTQPSFTVNFGGLTTVRDALTNQLAQTGSSGMITITPDFDGDGVADAVDACPTQPGPAACNGCPSNVCGSCGTAPDADNDGRPDCQDNCPGIANPGQADCDHDGQGDACEGAPDCNLNGIPDACDLGTGASNDTDGNGVPDECQTDCNMNQLPDSWEVSTGRVPDLNADGIPDTCQGGIVVDSATDNLGSPSGLDVRVHTFDNLPFAETSVTLTLDAVGDLDNPSEWIDVRLNGGAPRRCFATNGHICPSTPDRAVIALTRAEFNELRGPTGALTVTLTCPVNVDGTECKQSGMTQLRLQYVGIDERTGDCNGNRRLDVVETHEGSVPDCNGNKVPDSCDIARGAALDCNADGIPDSCQIAANPALDCNHNGVIDTCDVAGGGTAIDCDGNGRIDSCQVVEDPASDCNHNGIPDTCDVAAGGSQVDCDGNGRIDSCQVVEDPASDCNANGRPDSCDIALGFSIDRDGNHVPDECQTVSVPSGYPTIQSAIDSAPVNVMRIILVAPGTYAGPIDFKGKPIYLKGAGPASTALTGSTTSGSVVRMMSAEPAIARLEGFRIAGGIGGTPLPSAPSAYCGGGLLAINSAASIANCVFEGNTAPFGAGAYFLFCTGTISNCTFSHNNSLAYGGGLQTFASPIVMQGCTIEANTATTAGGGIHAVLANPSIRSTVIRNNTSAEKGGGLSWDAGDSMTAGCELNGCTVTGNSAASLGGGVYVYPRPQLNLPYATLTLATTTVCTNLPRNVFGPYLVSGATTVCDCRGDVNRDGFVNGGDIGILLAYWGPNPSAPEADLNNDAMVDGNDLGLLLSNWGICPP